MEKEMFEKLKASTIWMLKNMFNTREYKVGDETCFGEVTMVAHWGFIAVNMDTEKVSVFANSDWSEWYNQGRK